MIISTIAPKSAVLKHHSIRSLIFACGFLCLLAGGAQASTAKWEYLVINAAGSTRQLQTLLNNQALEGWELVQLTDRGVAVFKRRK